VAVKITCVFLFVRRYAGWTKTLTWNSMSPVRLARWRNRRGGERESDLNEA
jgi:hypothetical protein